MEQKSKLYYNTLIVIKAAAIGVWFYAINRIMYRYYSSPTWTEIFVMLGVSSVILIMEDGMLSELHNLKPETVAAISNNQPNNSSTFAALTAGKHIGGNGPPM